MTAFGKCIFVLLHAYGMILASWGQSIVGPGDITSGPVDPTPTREPTTAKFPSIGPVDPTPTREPTTTTSPPTPAQPTLAPPTEEPTALPTPPPSSSSAPPTSEPPSGPPATNSPTPCTKPPPVLGLGEPTVGDYSASLAGFPDVDLHWSWGVPSGATVKFPVEVSATISIDVKCTFCDGRVVTTPLSRDVSGEFSIKVRYKGIKGLAKVLAKFVPGLNLLSAGYDIYSAIQDAKDIWKSLKEMAKAAANTFDCLAGQRGRRLLAQDTLRFKSSRPPLLLLEVDLDAAAAAPAQNRKLLQSIPVDPDPTPSEIDLFPDDTSILPPLACSFATAESVFAGYGTKRCFCGARENGPELFFAGDDGYPEAPVAPSACSDLDDLQPSVTNTGNLTSSWSTSVCVPSICGGPVAAADGKVVVAVTMYLDFPYETTTHSTMLSWLEDVENTLPGTVGVVSIAPGTDGKIQAELSYAAISSDEVVGLLTRSQSVPFSLPFSQTRDPVVTGASDLSISGARSSLRLPSADRLQLLALGAAATLGRFW